MHGRHTRTPSWDAHVTEPELFINEVEVIMQAFALIGFEKSLSALFVMPRFISLTALHSRENMHQAGFITTLLEDIRVSSAVGFDLLL